MLLPIALIIWLLPLIGIAMTAIKPAADLTAGNYFGLPSRFAGFGENNFLTNQFKKFVAQADRNHSGAAGSQDTVGCSRADPARIHATHRAAPSVQRETTRWS